MVVLTEKVCISLARRSRGANSKILAPRAKATTSDDDHDSPVYASSNLEAVWCRLFSMFKHLNVDGTVMNQKNFAFPKWLNAPNLYESRNLHR